jgi:hypothetical protein
LTRSCAAAQHVLSRRLMDGGAGGGGKNASLALSGCTLMWR